MSKYIYCKNYNVGNQKLQNAARTACDFWNEHVEPEKQLEFELAVVDIFENDIARAYQANDALWQIEFNRAFLDQYSQEEAHHEGQQNSKQAYVEENFAQPDNKHTDKELGEKKILVVMIHEIAHILGFGGDRWRRLFNEKGHLDIDYHGMDNSLKGQQIGHDGDHWDDHAMGHAINGDQVFFSPATVAVMDFIGHKVKKQLSGKNPFEDIFEQYKKHDCAP